MLLHLLEIESKQIYLYQSDNATRKKESKLAHLVSKITLPNKEQNPTTL